MDSPSYYIGLMSGTSADGVDLALVDFNNNNVSLIAHYYQAYPESLRKNITQLYLPSDNEIDKLGCLNIELAHYFADVIQQFLTQQQLTPSNIIAIGNHGQTIRHRPDKTTKVLYPFTHQIGCSQTLACLTGIKTIGNFRVKDMALGGQGAPLVPAFHQYLFAKHQQDICIVNLGGIANITLLPANEEQTIVGYDTGPANALLDSWCYKNTGNRYDDCGNWASQGCVNDPLLEDLLSDPYFTKPAPKSTGREYFTLQWLEGYLSRYSLSPVDVQTTLAALTCYSITNEITKLTPKAFVYLCGGGINNNHCYKLLEQILSGYTVKTINTINLNNNAFEAMAFAWLAFAYDKKIYGNIPAVTGANKQTVLGSAYYP